MPANTLKTISGEFATKAREAEFQGERLPETIRHARLIFLASAVLNSLFLASDLRFLGQPHFPYAIAARLAVIAVSLACWFAMRRAGSFGRAQAVMLVWEGVTALAVAELVTTRSDLALFVVLMLPAIFYLAPTSFRCTVAAGAGCAALLLAAYLLPPPLAPTAFGLLVAVVTANVALALVVVRSNRLRRLEWSATRAERRAGEELAQSRRQFESMFRASPIPLVVTTLAEGRLVSTNDAAIAYFGVRPEEIGVDRIGKVYADPSDRRRLLDILARDGRVDNFETVLRLADGSRRDVLVSAALLEVEGEPHLISGLVDITERRQAEAALAASEARTRTLADILPPMVWVMRPCDGETTYVNRRFLRYYGPIGTAREARVSRNHPDDAERMAGAWRVASERGRTFEVQGRLRRHDGVYRWHKLVMIPIRREGRIAEWLGTALDIDDILTAQEKLRETTDLLRLAQEAAGAGVWEWTIGSGDLHLCAKSALMFGLDGSRPATLRVEEWMALLDADDAAAVLERAHAAVRDRTSYSAEIRVRAAGGVRWVQGVGRLVCDAEDRPVRMVGLNLDITERKQAETVLGEARAAAEAARREAERASEAKTDFLATMSHEIRTPLNAVLGYTELLLGSPRLGDEERRHAERIETAGGALLTVVDDILDFSRIEAGAVELDPAPFQVRALVDDLVSITKGQAERKGLALEIAVGPDVPDRLVGDRDRLRQVLLNLVNNAVKFTPAGSVTLGVEAASFPGQAGRAIRFAVTDTGIGIPENKTHLLFDRFSQVDGSIRREFGGTGLGLAICKHLVELMGGTIGVRSEPGRGSTFWLVVPLPEAPASVAGPVSRAADPSSGRRRRVLLAEDLDINQELVRAVLERAGHEVDVVSNGADAVAAVQAKPYDLVLMDVQMPGMDGLAATRHIRALNGADRWLPIIGLTANVLPFQVAAFREAGMDDHVGKPFRQGDLLAAIERWAASPGSRPDGATSDPLDEAAYGSLLELVGRDGMDRLLDRLSRLLGDVAFRGAARSAEDRARLGREAHALVSAVGQVGFTGFSEECRALEAACAGAEADVLPCLERARAAHGRVLARIAALRAAAA